MYSRRGKGRSNSKDLVLPALPLMLRKSMPHAQPTQHHHHCCAVGRCDGTGTALRPPLRPPPRPPLPATAPRGSVCIAGNRMRPGGPSAPRAMQRAPCSTAQHQNIPGRRSKGYTPSAGAVREVRWVR